MEGITFVVDPENTFVSIRNETNIKTSMFDTSTYPHTQYWHSLINFYKSLGFIVGEDQSVSKNIRNDYIKGNKGSLEIKGNIYPAGCKIDFYQNINFENRNGGEYDFNKYKKMPYLIRLQLINTCNKTIKFLQSIGLTYKPTYHPKTAVDKLKRDYVESCHHPQKDMNFNLDDLNGITSESYNNKDRDKNIIYNGEVKYFRGFDGCLNRGKTYHNINNMWWVITDKYTIQNIASFELFNPNENDFKQRRIKRGYAPIEYVNKHVSSDRKYVAVSIKHSVNDKETSKFILWGDKRTLDDKSRCFSGYTQNFDKCELYTLEDFQNTYGNGYIKCDEPVKVTFNLCKKYKSFDTVLVDKDEYKKYLSFLD